MTLRLPKLPIVLVMLTFASAASALEVTNLDHRPHTVRFVAAGVAQDYAVPPSETVAILGEPNGTLSLLSAATPRRGKGVLQSDGILSGVITAARNQDIPAETRDAFVIWPDGTFNVQQRRRGGGYSR